MEPRVRLVRRLLATTGIRAVVLSAPAGYGKTTLLEAWSRAEARPVVWLGPERPREDAADVERELAHAVGALRDETRATVLVVDDADAAGGVAGARALEAARRDLPAAITVVLSGRGAPPAALGRLRSAWPVLELGPEELAMTHSEAEAMLRAAGRRLDEPAIATLLARTEGWPAGLRLAIAALDAQADAARAVDGFHGDDRAVADYLRDELLAEITPDGLAFLLRASILNSLSGPICDAVLERHDSGAMLYDLSRSPAPVRATDRQEEGFRLHPLVAEMLRAELRRVDPELKRALHARATEFFEREGDLGAALDQAIAGAHFDAAAGVLWRLAPSALFGGRAGMLDGWLAGIGDAQIGRRPLLALTAALAAFARGKPEQVERWTGAARSAVRDGSAARRRSVDVAVALLRTSVAPGEAGTLRDRASDALASAPDGGPWGAVCSLLRGVSHGLIGDLEAARRDLDDGVRRGAVAAPAIEALCLVQLALYALLEGDVEDGAVLAERARSRVDARGLEEATARGLVCAVSAFARAYRGRVPEARADLAEAGAILSARDTLAPWYDAQARLAMARAELRLSDVAAARALTAQAARFAARIPDAARLRTWIADAAARADQFAVEALAGSCSLTTAELRVLRYLPSHLTFREIAGCLDLSANTVKTQAHAVYRKLDASSRSTAVEHARVIGLLDG